MASSPLLARLTRRALSSSGGALLPGAHQHQHQQHHLHSLEPSERNKRDQAGWRSARFQQLAAAVLAVYVLLGTFWLKVLLVEDRDIEWRVIERQAALTQTVAGLTVCHQSLNEASTQFNDAKEQQRVQRRRRNTRALEIQQQERACTNSKRKKTTKK
jgi:hypothetical protein